MVRDFPEQECQAPTPYLQNLAQQERSPGSCRIFLERAEVPEGKTGAAAGRRIKPDSEQRNYILGTELVMTLLLWAVALCLSSDPKMEKRGAIPMLPASLGFPDPSSSCPRYGWPRSPATGHAGDQAQTSALTPQLQTAQRSTTPASRE